MVSPVNHIKYNYYDGCGNKLSSTAEWGWVISKLKWPSSDSLRSHYDSGGEYLLNSVVYWCSFDQNKSTNPKVHYHCSTESTSLVNDPVQTIQILSSLRAQEWNLAILELYRLSSEIKSDFNCQNGSIIALDTVGFIVCTALSHSGAVG